MSRRERERERSCCVMHIALEYCGKIEITTIYKSTKETIRWRRPMARRQTYKYIIQYFIGYILSWCSTLHCCDLRRKSHCSHKGQLAQVLRACLPPPPLASPTMITARRKAIFIAPPVKSKVGFVVGENH